MSFNNQSSLRTLRKLSRQSGLLMPNACSSDVQSKREFIGRVSADGYSLDGILSTFVDFPVCLKISKANSAQLT